MQVKPIIGAGQVSQRAFAKVLESAVLVPAQTNHMALGTQCSGYSPNRTRQEIRV